VKRIVAVVVVAVCLVPLLFEVRFDPRFSLPGTEERLDAEQEARYEACVEDAEREIHARVFARVDNPDVQRELLYRQGQAAKAACRADYPERVVEVETPLDVNLVDLTWRY
jgi:hypothetical protein